MRVSTNWLNEYVDLDGIDIIELGEKMTLAGNEIESVEDMVDATNLVVGYVLDKKQHPEADKLSVCLVDIAEKLPLQIVCGAANVDKGQKVIVSKIGAILPGGFEIKQARLRGVESNGMICALEELGIESKYIDEEDKDGIYVLNSDAPIGEDALEYLKYNDIIADYELTADRSDLLSIIGMAYETSAILNKEVKLPDFSLNEITERTSSVIDVEVKTKNCFQYLTRVVKDIEINESPNFIKARLISSGIRPINNVVDISNYVMIEYGQPLHFFDADKLGTKILVRMAKDNEEVITLDNEKRKLNTSDIVITDGKEVVALAGVMGGLSTEVESDTKNIIIEAAIFNPLNVRYTSKEILRSESSIRFEKGIDPNITEIAINRAAYLLNKYASGNVLKGIVKYDDIDHKEKTIKISIDKINSVLGMKLTNKDIELVFSKLGFEFELKKKIYKVNIPTRRQDVSIQEDLIEEIGRIHGYDNIKGILPTTSIKSGTYNDKYLKIKQLRSRIQALGLDQVTTYSLVGEKDYSNFTLDEFEKIELQSPMSEDKKIMRYSLIPSLLNVVDYNFKRNLKNTSIYEISNCYYKKNTDYLEETKLSGAMTGIYLSNSWQGKEIKVDFYLIKGIVENILDYLGLKDRYIFETDNIPNEYHPGQSASILVDNKLIGHVGKVHPNIGKHTYVFELSLSKLFKQKVRGIKYKEVSKYPSVSRDAAFIINKDIKVIDVIKVIKKASKVLKQVEVFDVYVGDIIEDNKKSIAFNFVFEDSNKTLEEEEITNNFNNIIEAVKKEFKAKLRG